MGGAKCRIAGIVAAGQLGPDDCCEDIRDRRFSVRSSRISRMGFAARSRQALFPGSETWLVFSLRLLFLVT
jgi:hypothetical protein